MGIGEVCSAAVVREPAPLCWPAERPRKRVRVVVRKIAQLVAVASIGTTAQALRLMQALFALVALISTASAFSIGQSALPSAHASARAAAAAVNRPRVAESPLM